MEKARLYFLTVFKSKNFWIRVLFVIIAAFFWFLMKLSKSGYSSSIKYPVIYEDIPRNKILVGSPMQEIELKISSYGFRLLGYEVRKKEPLKIDVKNRVRQLDDETYYWLPNLYREELETQLDAQTSLLRIEPDTVYLTLSTQVKKQVPVVANVKNSFASGYELDGNPVLKPEMVTVAGPKVFIDSIVSIESRLKSLNRINQTTTVELNLISPHEKVTLSPSSVSYTLNVDEFTEKVVQVPIRVTNIPIGYNAEIIPAQVSVRCKVALKRIDQLQNNDLDVFCDFDQLNEFPNRKRLILNMKSYSEAAIITELSHKSVDFLLFKK